MNITFQVDHLRRRIDSRGDGDITVDILMSHLRDRYEPSISSYRELLDLRSASTNMNDGDMLRLVAIRRLLAVTVNAGPTAAIASDAVLFGMLRAFAALTDEISSIMVFYHIEPAVEWLESVPTSIAIQ